MNLNAIRTLVAIAEHGSFAVAAEQVHLSPAAVSQQMRALEDELQVMLFDRTTRPPRFNAHGTYVAEQARALLAEFDAFADRARATGEVAGRMVLGCIAGVSGDVLPSALVNLRKRHPGLTIRMESGFSEALLHRVQRRELDAAIVTEPAAPLAELKLLPIVSERLVVATPHGSPARCWDEALRIHPFLRLHRRSGMARLIEESLHRARIVVEDAMELDTTETILIMVRAGLGAGVVPESRLAGRRRQFRTFPFGDPAITRRIVLAERVNNHRSNLSSVLYDELKRLTETSTGAAGHP